MARAVAWELIALVPVKAIPFALVRKFVEALLVACGIAALVVWFAWVGPLRRTMHGSVGHANVGLRSRISVGYAMTRRLVVVHPRPRPC